MTYCSCGVWLSWCLSLVSLLTKSTKAGAQETAERWQRSERESVNSAVLGSDCRSTLWLLPWKAVSGFLVTIFNHLKVQWPPQNDLQTLTWTCARASTKIRGNVFLSVGVLKSETFKIYCVFVNVRERVGEWQTEALYIFALHVIRRPCSPEPPNTKCVWVAASGDKMAISTISQPSISFQQIDAVAGAYEWNPEIDWTETIRLSEQDEGWNLWNHREDSGGKWITCQILSKGERKQNCSRKVNV